MPKQLFLCLFLLLFCLRGFSAVFVVTSNADSGPGTLRDALMQAAANGITEKDYIDFNIPDVSEAGRTITLITQLPNVSSNLVIDGTTQNGAVFGASNAKVIMQPASKNSDFNTFTLIDVDGFEIYGMYIRDFINPFVYTLYGETETNLTSVLYVESSRNLQIGALGKGNVFTNNEYVLKTAFVSSKNGQPYPAGIENLKVYANFIGFEPDGKSYRPNTLSTSGFDLTACKGNIEIGGNDVADRNFFGYCTSYIELAGNGPATAFATTINIINNYFDYDINGKYTNIPIAYGDAYMLIFRSDPNYDYYSYPYNFIINNNKIQYPLCTLIYEIAGDITFQGNEELLGSQAITGTEKRIDLNTQSKIIVGGILPGEENTIYGCQLALVGAKSTTLQHTQVFCVPNETPWTPSGDILAILPKITINKVTSTMVAGIASPLSSVELYWDDDCHFCQPQTYFATVMADANGNWSYNGPIKTGVIGSATLNGFTSMYTPSAALNSYTITQSSCGLNNGSLTGFIFSNSGGYQIQNDKNETISTNADANNLPPGNYVVTTLNGGSCVTKYNFTIYDATPVINSDNLQIVQPACDNKTASITGLNLSASNYQILQNDNNAYTFKWLDADNNVKGTSLDLIGIGPGTYHLEVSYKGQCPTTYGPVTLKNTTGPNIDQTNQIVKSTNCGQSTGSITNITATGTGTIKYVWLNAQQQQVGSSADLTGQPAGTYKLQITDDTQCGPVYSVDVVIPETNGIIMDESKVQVTNALCGGTGSITGIQVTGASSYKWADANNHTLITTTPDVGALAPGSYTLTAANSYGCSKSSAVYIISQPVSFPYPVYAATYTKACNLLANGGVLVATDGSVKSARWVDAQGTTIGTGSTLSNVLAGTYQLYLTDNNGCEKLYNSYTIQQYPEFTVANYATITADECGLNNGSIGATTIAGGIPPYTYSWSDANNKSVGSTNLLTNLAAGTYILHVNDNGCGSVDITYTVTEQTFIPAAPSVTNVQLCSSGNGLLTVNNPSASTTYRLYASESSTQPIDEQKGGRFNINVPGNVSYYVSEIDGTCESSRAEIDVTVGVSATDIANAFTPNGDGINDYWQIKNINNYTNATIQVFNRYGQLLFESKGYAKPFDGTYKGQKLPAGVYYYIINLNAKCNLLSGSLTLIR